MFERGRSSKKNKKSSRQSVLLLKSQKNPLESGNRYRMMKQKKKKE